MCWMQGGAWVPGWLFLHSPEATRISLSLGAIGQVSIFLAAPKSWATDGDTVCPPLTHCATPWPAHFHPATQAMQKRLIPLQPPLVNIRTASSLTAAIPRPGLFAKGKTLTSCKEQTCSLKWCCRTFTLPFCPAKQPAQLLDPAWEGHKQPAQPLRKAIRRPSLWVLLTKGSSSYTANHILGCI